MNNFKETLLDFRDDTLDFIDNHRRGLIIMCFLAIFVLLGVIILLMMMDPVKITISNVDDKMGEIIGTRARSIELKATAYKNNELMEDQQFTWEVSGGKVKLQEDGTVEWVLPTDEGTYSITAKTGDHSGTKKLTIIGNDLSELYETSDAEITVLDEDSDGLPDFYEASNSSTSQTSPDTDEDGLYDGDEIIMGLEPTKADSKGDGIKDGERKLEYTFKSENVTMEMVGKGNFTQTSMDKYSTETLDNVNSVIDGIYAFYTEVALDSAEITIKYNKEAATSKNINENNLAVYQLNEDENTFKKLRTTVDASNSTVKFNPENEVLGKYFIADSSVLTSNLATELVFVIDNSGSMYSKEEYGNSEENDPDFKRVDVVNDLVDKLQGNYRFGVGKFTFQYKEVVSLSSDKATVKNNVLTIKTLPENFSGTYIGAGLEGGLKQFSDNVDQNRRYIILLSDGTDTTNVAGYNQELLANQITVAKQKGVKVYSVGLGAKIDEEGLKNIANQTNGKYYFASTADDLEVVFDEIAADLNYNLFDSNNDDINDSVVLADSGFLVGRDGFSFSNFSNTQVKYGYGYGMVLFAKLFYENGLPDNLNAKTVTDKATNEVITAPAASPKSMIDNQSTTLRTFKPVSLTVLSELPTNFWASSITNGALTINATHKSALTALGFTTYGAINSDKEAKFNKYEALRYDMTPLLNEEDELEPTIEDKDVEMLKVLSRLDITKYRDEKFHFFAGNDDAFAKIKDELVSGKTVMIRINNDYTVLATKLLADSKNMNKFKIEVYDPNYAGIPKYIEVVRTKFSDIAEISKVVTDKYEYKFKYQGTDVGICISVPNVYEQM